MFSRGFQQGFRKGCKQSGPFQFKNFSRMQVHMSYCQFSMLNKQIQMVQLAQNKLTATNLLMQQMKMNYLLLNEEAEMGLNSNSEDLGKYLERKFIDPNSN